MRSVQIIFRDIHKCKIVKSNLHVSIYLLNFCPYVPLDVDQSDSLLGSVDDIRMCQVKFLECSAFHEYEQSFLNTTTQYGVPLIYSMVKD